MNLNKLYHINILTNSFPYAFIYISVLWRSFGIKLVVWCPQTMQMSMLYNSICSGSFLIIQFMPLIIHVHDAAKIRNAFIQLCHCYKNCWVLTGDILFPSGLVIRWLPQTWPTAFLSLCFANTQISRDLKLRTETEYDMEHEDHHNTAHTCSIEIALKSFGLTTH